MYFDDGKFLLRSFKKVGGTTAADIGEALLSKFQTITRSEEEIEKSEVNINELCGINDWTMAIDGFMDPYVTCCFISETHVFLNLFYN